MSLSSTASFFERLALNTRHDTSNQAQLDKLGGYPRYDLC